MYRYSPAQQEFYAARFGAMLRRWRERNGWTQYTAYHWAKGAGFDALAPSTVSVLENGKAPKPRPETFFALGELHRRLAMKDYGQIRDKHLAELVKAATPLCDDDGRVWGPADFWACHVGLMDVPKAYGAEPIDQCPAEPSRVAG